MPRLLHGLGVFQGREYHLALPDQPVGHVLDRLHAGPLNGRFLSLVGSGQVDGAGQRLRQVFRVEHGVQVGVHRRFLLESMAAVSDRMPGPARPGDTVKGHSSTAPSAVDGTMPAFSRTVSRSFP